MRDPDSGRGRLDLGDTVDDFADESTPVEHLIAKVAAVEGVVADHAATLAERYDMPSTEAWRAMVTRQDTLEGRVAVCEREREHRAKWAVAWRWAKGVTGGSVVAGLVWAVTMIGDGGAAREAAARDKARAEEIYLDVRVLRESFAADHALLQLLLTRGIP